MHVPQSFGESVTRGVATDSELELRPVPVLPRQGTPMDQFYAILRWISIIRVNKYEIRILSSSPSVEGPAAPRPRAFLGYKWS